MHLRHDVEPEPVAANSTAQVMKNDNSSVTARSPLQVPAFRRLAAGYTINELGNWIGDVALAVLVFDETKSALATAALFIALRFLPALLAPLLTSRIEPIAARRSLPGIYLAECAIFVALAWLAGHFSLSAVIVLGAVDGLLAIAAGALTRGATAALLMSDGTLRRGNAILNMGFSAGGAVGPALAGAMVGLFGVASALLVDGGTFAIVAVIYATTTGLRLERSASANWRERLRAGLSEAWSQPGVRRLLAAQAVAMAFFTAVIPIEIVYVKHTLGGTASGYGALLAAWGTGMVLGSIAFAARPRVNLLTMLVLSVALIGAGYAGIALAPDLVVACAFSAVGGLGNGTMFVTLVSAIQQSVSLSAQNSVMSIYGAINQLMPGIGYLLGGVITTLASPRVTYAIAAGGALVVLAMIAVRPPPGLQSIASPDELPDTLPGPAIAPELTSRSA
jgi:MFS family permease